MSACCKMPSREQQALFNLCAVGHGSHYTMQCRLNTQKQRLATPALGTECGCTLLLSFSALCRHEKDFCLGFEIILHHSSAYVFLCFPFLTQVQTIEKKMWPKIGAFSAKKNIPSLTWKAYETASGIKLSPRSPTPYRNAKNRELRAVQMTWRRCESALDLGY